MTLQIQKTSNLTDEQLTQAVRFAEVYGKYFPKSLIHFSKSPIGGNLCVMCFLLQDDEFPNKIEHNDPVRTFAHLIPIDGGFEFDFKPSLSTVKPENQMYYCDTVRLKGVRIVKGDFEKIIKSFDKTLAKFKALCVETAKTRGFVGGHHDLIVSKLRDENGVI